MCHPFHSAATSTTAVSSDSSTDSFPSAPIPSVVVSSSSPSSCRTSLLAELQEASHALSLALSEAQRAQLEIDRLSSRLADLSFPSSVDSSSSLASPPPVSRPLLPGGSLCVNDWVRIRYPRPHQPAEGRVESARGSYIYVRASNGSLVHRFEKNLLLVQRSSSFS